MRVLFTTLREQSHLLALTPFVSALKRGGHEVAVAAPPDFAERVAALGATFFAFGHPGEAGLGPTWKRMREVSSEDDLKRIAWGELFAGLCAGAAIPGLVETIERWKPSLVASESHEFAGHVAAEKTGVPHIRVAICGGDAELEIRACAAPYVDAHRRDHGLPPDPHGDHLRAEPSVTLFPSSFAAAASPLQTFSFRTAKKEAPPLPDWWAGSNAPFVYMTLGTVAGRFDAIRAIYRAMIDAVGDRPVRALLTVGSTLPLEALGDVPSNVHVERFVPQDDVIPHASAIVCHGGSGTVLSGLAAGVPMVVVPQFADQPHNASRIAALGAGLAIPIADVSSETLRQSLTRVVDDVSFRDAARAIALEIGALPLVDEVGSVVERLKRT